MSVDSAKALGLGLTKKGLKLTKAPNHRAEGKIQFVKDIPTKQVRSQQNPKVKRVPIVLSHRTQAATRFCRCAGGIASGKQDPLANFAKRPESGGDHEDFVTLIA